MLFTQRRLEAPIDYPVSEHIGLFQPMLRAMPAVRVLCSGLFKPSKSMMYRATLTEESVYLSRRMIAPAVQGIAAFTAACVILIPNVKTADLIDEDPDIYTVSRYNKGINVEITGWFVMKQNVFIDVRCKINSSLTHQVSSRLRGRRCGRASLFHHPHRRLASYVH